MALAVDAATVTRVNATTDFSGNPVTATTGSFTPATGSLLVAVLQSFEVVDLGVTTGAVSGGGLTWTKRAERGTENNGGGANSEGYAAIFTAPVPSGSSMTVTGSCTYLGNEFGGYAMTLKVYIVTGQDASPIGATGTGGPSATSGNALAPTLFTSTGIGRAFYAWTEQNGASGSAGANTSSDTYDQWTNAGFASGISVFKASNHSASTSVAGAIATTAATVGNWAAVEILEAAAGGPTGAQNSRMLLGIG